MPKKIEDIVPKNKKSIRDIPIPVRRSESVPPPPPPPQSRSVYNEPRPVEPTSVLPRLRSEGAEWQPHKKKRSRKLLWGSAVVVILLGAFGALTLQSGATLTYTPKTSELTFTDEYTVYQSPPTGEMGYSVIKISGDKSAVFAPTGEGNVSVKSSGRVVIYNDQAAAQSLVKTTRLETSDGKIYRITSDVSVPAKGNIEVTAEADKPGALGNIGLSDFTIPGLKGTPKFQSVYARSKTAMTGGFEGVRKSVNDADLAKAKPQLEDSLKNELIAMARTQIPLEYVLFPDLSTITYESLPQENTADGNVKYSERGNLNAIIFKRDDFAKYLAYKKLNADPGDVEIPDFSKISVTFSSGSVNLLKDTTIKIKVAGSATLRAVIDEGALRDDLAGKSKTEMKTVLENYPAIDNVSVSFRPFWKSSFPTDVNKIKVQRNNAS